MSDVNDLLQTRLDADVLAGDTPKEFEVTVLLLNFFIQCSLMPFSLESINQSINNFLEWP